MAQEQYQSQQRLKSAKNFHNELCYRLFEKNPGLYVEKASQNILDSVYRDNSFNPQWSFWKNQPKPISNRWVSQFLNECRSHINRHGSFKIAAQYWAELSRNIDKGEVNIFRTNDQREKTANLGFSLGFISNLWSTSVTNSKQLLRIAEVSDFTSLAKSTINLWVAQGKFPQPIALSPTIKVWKLQQIHEWIDAHSEASAPFAEVRP